MSVWSKNLSSGPLIPQKANCSLELDLRDFPRRSSLEQVEKSWIFTYFLPIFDNFKSRLAILGHIKSIWSKIFSGSLNWSYKEVAGLRLEFKQGMAEPKFRTSQKIDFFGRWAKKLKFLNFLSIKNAVSRKTFCLARRNWDRWVDFGGRLTVKTPVLPLTGGHFGYIVQGVPVGPSDHFKSQFWHFKSIFTAILG